MPRVSWALMLVLIGVVAWLRIFTTWFAQDDFRWLLRAGDGVHRGILLLAMHGLSMR